MPAEKRVSRLHGNLVNAADTLLWNAEEVRRRSLTVWRGVPAKYAHWKPDADAMTCIEIVRHVLEGEFLYMAMLKAGRSVAEDTSPFNGRSFTTIEDEIQFAQPFRMALVELLQSLGPTELETRKGLSLPATLTREPRRG